MEFDKTKVYTTFNCDEVKIGSKGYFADSRENLISRVQSENEDYYWTLDNISLGDDFTFSTNDCSYRYFYLVEEPKEPTKRPCTREELIEMLWKQRIPMLKCNLNGFDYMVERVTDNYCYVYDCGNYTHKDLCENFTLLDGTELWVKE